MFIIVFSQIVRNLLVLSLLICLFRDFGCEWDKIFKFLSLADKFSEQFLYGCGIQLFYSSNSQYCGCGTV